MNNQRKLGYLILVMGTVCALSGSVAIWVLYTASFAEQRSRLVDTVTVQARLIEAVARFDIQMRARLGQDLAQAELDTLSQVREAHSNSRGIGETGEFVLARRDGDSITFLLTHRHDDLDNPNPIPFHGEFGEPIRRALSGASGSMVGLDYRGERVLAAYEPLAVHDLGVVAKIDVAEIRAPFVSAGAIAGGIAALLVLLGSTLFLRITNPLIRRLERSERRYRSLVDASASIVWTTDAVGRFIEPQPSFEQHTGIPWDAHMDQGWIKAVHPDDRVSVRGGWARALETRRPYEDSGRIWHAASGEYRHFVVRAVPIVEVDGTVTEWVGTVIDQHDRRRAEDEEVKLRDELDQAARLAAVGELAAGIAHEVNNPINTIINCAQLMKDGELEPALCDDIMGEGNRIAAIVRDLLQFAREDGTDFEPTDVGDVLRRTMSLVGESIRKRGIRVERDVAMHLPLVSARPGKLQQVLLNLVINAKDALIEDADNESKRIRVAATSDVAGLVPVVQLSVWDNGPGIPADRMARIFEPFFTSKRDRGGTGLGLSISKAISSDHGASLEVQSVPGEFTEFVLRIPAGESCEPPVGPAPVGRR